MANEFRSNGYSNGNSIPGHPYRLRYVMKYKGGLANKNAIEVQRTCERNIFHTLTHDIYASNRRSMHKNHVVEGSKNAIILLIQPI